MTGIMLFPVNIAFVMMFHKSSNRREYESKKQRAQRLKRERIIRRKNMAEKYKPKPKKVSGAAKLKAKAWTLWYKAQDTWTDVRIVLFRHVPKPPDEKEIQKRITNMGLD